MYPAIRKRLKLPRTFSTTLDCALSASRSLCERSSGRRQIFGERLDESTLFLSTRRAQILTSCTHIVLLAYRLHCLSTLPQEHAVTRYLLDHQTFVRCLCFKRSTAFQTIWQKSLSLGDLILCRRVIFLPSKCGKAGSYKHLIKYGKLWLRHDLAFCPIFATKPTSLRHEMTSNSP